jgi:hypothetical protein
MPPKNPPKYRTIRGKVCEVELLDLGEKLIRAGRLELGGAVQLWENALDGNRVTDRERNSIKHIIETAANGISNEADEFLKFWLNEAQACIVGGDTVEIDRVKYDNAMIQVADLFKKKAGGGPLSIRAAEGVWFSALDGPGVTRREMLTLQYILGKYDFEALARSFLQQKLEWLVTVNKAVGEAMPKKADPQILTHRDAQELGHLPPVASIQPIFSDRFSVGDSGQAGLQDGHCLAGGSGGQAALQDGLQDGQSLAGGGSGQLALRAGQSSVAVARPPAGGVGSPPAAILGPSLPANRPRCASSSATPEPAPKRQRVDTPSKLTRQASVTIQQLRDIFEKCDRDKDGVISKIELIKACSEQPHVADFFGLPAKIRQEDGTRTQFEAFFQPIAQENDKQIRWAEILANFVSKRAVVV